MQNQVADIRKNRESFYASLMRILWLLLGVGLVATAIFFIVLSRSDLPSLKELENPKSELASEIFGFNSMTIGRFYIENRVPVEYKDLSPYLVEALVATEDARFYQHSGIDFKALGRVLVKTLILRQTSAGGASTITQQLAKLLFTEKPASGLERAMQKFKEWIIAIRLEKSYTKEEIIAMYLNKFDFINGAYGIKAASEIYFGKKQDALSLEEAATLVGMLKNPALYNPRRFPDRARERRNVVLSQMTKFGNLSPENYEIFSQKPLDMTNFNRATQSEGMAPYYRSELAKDLRDILSDKTRLKSNGQPYNIYRDGLKIYTTIDPEMQRMAEEQMTKHMAQLQAKYWKHWAKLDPWKYRVNNAVDNEMEAREAAIERAVRESDRYISFREVYLTEISEKLKTVITDYQLRDVDVERMVREDKEPGYIAKLEKSNYISDLMADNYRTMRSSEHYAELKSQWNKLQATVKTDFRKPVKMKVFAYNSKMEKDTTMSPLDSIKYHKMFLQIGSLAVDPFTGFVKAWVGGINHKYFKFDHVRSRRQVGSTFKPFVYATAIALKGFSPCYKVDDMPYTIQPGEGNFKLIKAWSPSNSSKFSYSPMTLREGLRTSTNSITVYLMKEIGSPEPVIGMVHSMGIDSSLRYPNGQYVIPRVPSVALGAADLMVWEMAGAYTTFPNNGKYNKPIHILKIEDRNGRVLYEYMPEERQVLNPRYNYVMLDLLQYNVAGAPSFSSIKTKTGGKTGTTNNYVDGWFMGVTPNLVVATWVGGDDRWIRFRDIGNGQGATVARPFFVNFIKAIEDNPKIEWDVLADFKKPTGDIGIELNCGVYDKLTNPGAFEGEESIYDDGFGDELEQGNK